MDIRVTKDKGLLLLASLALILLGLGASFLTWQSVKRQQNIVREHMLHSAHALARGIESSLSRQLLSDYRMRGRGMRMLVEPELREEFKKRVETLLDDIVEDKDISFLGIYAPDGECLNYAGDRSQAKEFDIPQPALALTARGGVWHELMQRGGESSLALAVRSNLVLIAHTLPPRELMTGGMMGRSMFNRPPSEFPVLVMGVNVDKYVSAFQDFKRNAFLQTGYVFLVALVIWALALAYLRRRQQGLAFSRLERFHSRLLDAMPDGLVTVDSTGTIRAANPAAVNILDPDDEGLLGARWDELPLEPGEGPASADQDRLSGGWKQYVFGGRCLEILFRPIPGDEAGESLVLLRDRTKVHALEKDLAEAEKMAAVGRLAAGLAHEIRNPLSALRGFAQFFQDRFKGRSPEEEYAGTMVHEADRLNRVVTDMLFLAKPRPASRKKVDLEDLAGELEQLLRLDLEKKGLALETDLKAREIFADGDQIKQALLNLLLNSLRAVPEQGGAIEVFSRREDGVIRLGVRDNGRGMDEEERGRALEPFYTSRADGTGLGLSVVHKIMRDHGGRVEIASEPGQGTTVTLSFPEEES